MDRGIILVDAGGFGSSHIEYSTAIDYLLNMVITITLFVIVTVKWVFQN